MHYNSEYFHPNYGIYYHYSLCHVNVNSFLEIGSYHNYSIAPFGVKGNSILNAKKDLSVSDRSLCVYV